MQSLRFFGKMRCDKLSTERTTSDALHPFRDERNESSSQAVKMANIDLNQILVLHPAATFFVRIDNDSLKDANIYRGDVLIVDRSLTPQVGKMIVAVVDGEFCVQRMELQQLNLEVWGVITYVIHKML